MVILFPINRIERDQLREQTDDQIVTLSHVLDYGDEDIPVYETTEEFLTDIDDQSIDPNAYWCVEVRKVYVVSYAPLANKRYRVVCNTPEEARLLATILRSPDLTVDECYDGHPLTLSDKDDPDTTVLTLSKWLATSTNSDPSVSKARTPYIQSHIFTVTFTYETPLTGKTRCAVECRNNDEAMKIAHDANSVDGIKYVRTYPCKRPVGKNGIRMKAEDYWKMYGNK